MKNPATHLVCIGIAFGISLSCTNQSNDNQNSNDTMDSEMRNDTLNEGLPENDSVLNFRDGVIINEGKDELDTIQLPTPILQAIEDDSQLKSAQIIDKIMKEENGATLYEIVFYPVNGKEEKVTFNADGKRKPKP